jgi:hypothetical protein
MVQFAVAMKDAEWTVFRDGVAIHQGVSRSSAIALAEDLAFAAEEAGEDVDLIIQSYTGELTELHSGGGQPPRRRK